MSEIKPALTPAQWKLHDQWNAGKLIGGKLVGGPNLPGDRHGLAARCLHGQPFGFTWGDVDLLRGNANADDDIDAGFNERMRNLADRIEALLPPRES